MSGDLTYNELKEKAIALGISVKGNPKKEELELAIEEKLDEQMLAAKAATYESIPPEEKVVAPEVSEAVQKANNRRDAYLMVKCIVTPLREEHRTLPSELFCIASSTVTIKKVVTFNKTTLEPSAILNHLREQTMPVYTKFFVDGKEYTKTELVPAYNIKELDFTEEELEAVKAGTNK